MYTVFRNIWQGVEYFVTFGKIHFYYSQFAAEPETAQKLWINYNWVSNLTHQLIIFLIALKF